MRLFTILAYVVSVYGLAMAPAWAAPVAELPSARDFRVGDSWTFATIIRRGDTPVAIPREEYSVRAIDKGQVEFNRYAPDFDFFYLKTDQTERPPTDENGQVGAWRMWPLEVGKTWRYMEIRTLPTYQKVILAQDVSVSAFEEVVVPAGTFKAFKIVHRGTYCSDCWLATSGVIPRAQKFNLIAEDTYWYAPEVHQDVRHVEIRGDREITIELIKYSRGK